MSQACIEQNSNVVAGVLLILESVGISSIRPLVDDLLGGWEVVLPDTTLQLLKGTCVSHHMSSTSPRLTGLSILDVTIHSNMIKFGDSVVYEFDVFDLAEAIESCPGNAYKSLKAVIKYFDTLVQWLRDTCLSQYVNGLISWLGEGAPSEKLLEIITLRNQTITSLYLNQVLGEPQDLDDPMALLDMFEQYQLVDGIYDTPFGQISKQLVDIFTRVVFLTK